MERVFIQSRAEQVAGRLRGMLSRGELSDPLPPIRPWSRALGVGHGTVAAALGILRREGRVRVVPRSGARVATGTGRGTRDGQPRLVRWLFLGRDYPEFSDSADVMARIRDQLRPHGIGLSVEACDTVRLKAMRRRGPRSHELLMLPSFPRRLQEIFAGFGPNALLVGPPFPGVEMPFISIDVQAAVRDAVRSLAERGVPRVTLVLREGSRQPVEGWIDHSLGLRGDVAYLPEGLMEQSAAAARLAARLRPPHALVAVYTVPANLLMTALAQAGFRVPREIEVIGVNTTVDSVRACPVPPHYPYPSAAFVRAVCQAVTRYFERGTLAGVRKLVPLRAVTPAG